MNCNCTKCSPSKPCGCNDTALTNPCTYTDCSIGSERCSDIQCAECVSYCGTTFQIGGLTEVIRIEKGERLDSIIQKFALMLSQGVGACTANDVNHAPYNVYATTITNSSITVVWNGESAVSAGINVYYDDGVTGYLLANAVPIALGVNTFTIPLLTPSTDYTIKLTSIDGLGGSCDSVELIVSTIA